MDGRTLRAFGRLTRAWLLQISRERATIFWMFAFPILFVVIFGLAFGREGPGSFPVGVASDERTPVGAALVQAFRRVPVLKVSTGGREVLEAQLRDGDLRAVVTLVPSSSASAVAAGASTVVISYDPSQSTTAQVVLPIIRRVIDDVDQQLSGRPPLLTVEEQRVGATDLRYIDFFLPGVIAFSIMQAGMFTAIPLVQLRVTRVLKRIGATPIPRSTVLASQGVARLVLAVVQTVVLLATGRLLFGIHISSNIPGMAAFVLLGSLVFLGFGLAVSGLARSEEAVPALVQVVSFPMMFLAGVFWPIDNFPAFIQPLSRLLPLTFLGDGLRQVMVNGTPLNPLWLDAAALVGWAVLGGALAVRLFRWE
jgi:ABC-2 type transport system permease protein